MGIPKKCGGTDPEKLKATLQRNIDIGFHPKGCNTIKSLVDHEFGHALDDLYGFSDMDEVIDRYKTLCKQGQDKAKEALSVYAMKNKKEFIAEAWSEYLNNPNPRPIAKDIGRMMEQKIKEFKKK
ncbi:hypothetical protein [Methanoregula formicica]|uniref:Uncharacterized protein n=1 Tax=Methanoregula formicica (strain DSM 22288 / NBRC 105244 / SMSP) TaxID=593750 RepID=L0HHG5_METFS|nr:hypothetical protein [Methanoregula formicica]AGB02529.1 hypothetical protein Metfor_1496 [Methanoregula formicica SMSP]